MKNKKYDLTIVGGGALGTFHAFPALNKGLKVLQLEKDNYPVGSTVRNFGQVVPSGVEGDWFNYGVDSTKIYNEIHSETDISVRQNGSLYIASDFDELNLLDELKQHYDNIGYPCQSLDGKDIIRKHPTVGLV